MRMVRLAAVLIASFSATACNTLPADHHPVSVEGVERPAYALWGTVTPSAGRSQAEEVARYGGRSLCPGDVTIRKITMTPDHALGLTRWDAIVICDETQSQGEWPPAWIRSKGDVAWVP